MMDVNFFWQMAEVKRTSDVVCKVSDFGESRAIAISAQGRQNLANPRMLYYRIICSHLLMSLTNDYSLVGTRNHEEE